MIDDYFNERQIDFDSAFMKLRGEESAIGFCEGRGFSVGTTPTRSTDHHQSAKALVSAVTGIAEEVCARAGVDLDPNPQSRCVWFRNASLHVTARNLDGAVSGLVNPSVIWEIKEYWGKTKGGSKMSDAVYECNLVGRELREFEERCGVHVSHAVFVDGKHQWSYRKSDLSRFIDLFHQGLIDYLFVGEDVETEWESVLTNLVAEDAYITSAPASKAAEPENGPGGY